MTSVTTKLQATQLAEQINDEFLTCKICYEPFKEPKCLSCLHTFCEECIDQHVSAQRSYKYSDYREFSCPICRKKTVIPTGGVRKLADNFLISSLGELLLAKRPSKIPYCEICKLVNQREREAVTKCVECQKLMCRSCSQTHQQMKITNNHNIYELEIEKDIMCKLHPNELVRFFCEACEQCVCVACTYTQHRDHDLVDFKDGVSKHKDKIEENLRRCRIKIGEIRTRLDMLKQCETRIQVAKNDIHDATVSFIDEIKRKELELLQELEEYYGVDTNAYIKKKDEFETLLDQLKSTCSLTDVMVKGKDIEMLLIKKQLCEKFEQFQAIQLDAIPKNIFKKVEFIRGSIHLGDIVDPEAAYHQKLEFLNEDDEDNVTDNNEGKRTSLSNSENEDDENNETVVDRTKLSVLHHADGVSSSSSYADVSDVDEVDEDENMKKTFQDQETQISNEDRFKLCFDTLRERETQTDIRMIHELAAPSHRDRFTRNMHSPFSRIEHKSIQTDNLVESQQPKQQPQQQQRGALSSQSSVDEENATASNPNVPVDMNKLSRRVRRHVRSGCLLAVLPINNDIIIIDPDANSLTILDKRGKQRYSIASSTIRDNYGKLDRGVRFLTPQGMLTIKLENDSKIIEPPQTTNPKQKAFENLPETSA